MTRRDLTGKTFGLLRVINSFSIGGRRQWSCICSCGQFTKRTTGNLTRSVSCGCLKTSQGGLSRTPTGVTWQAMMTRCYNSKQPQYVSYGGKGIKACEFMRVGPASIISLIGPRPDGKTIDRINNLGMYSCGDCDECRTSGWPLNVRWASKLEQNRNQSDLRYITIGGETKCLSEWSELSGIKRTTIHSRIRYGFKPEELLKPLCR